MRNLLLLLTVALMTSCSVNDICSGGDCWYKERGYNVDDLNAYVEMFRDDMIRRGITRADWPDRFATIDYLIENRTVTFEDRGGMNKGLAFFSGCNAIGILIVPTDKYPARITIQTSYWNSGLADGKKISLMYHELGHVVFGMDHSADINDIMYHSVYNNTTESVHELLDGLTNFFADFTSKNYSAACGTPLSSKGGGIHRIECNHGGLDF